MTPPLETPVEESVELRHVRAHGAFLIQKACKNLRKKSPVVAWTACSLFQRFFVKVSCDDYDYRVVAVAALCLGCKQEEIRLDMQSITDSFPIKVDKSQVARCERHLLRHIGFEPFRFSCAGAANPGSFLCLLCDKLPLPASFTCKAYGYINDMALTSLSCFMSPLTICAAALEAASRVEKVALPFANTPSPSWWPSSEDILTCLHTLYAAYDLPRTVPAISIVVKSLLPSPYDSAQSDDEEEVGDAEKKNDVEGSEGEDRSVLPRDTEGLRFSRPEGPDRPACASADHTAHSSTSSRPPQDVMQLKKDEIEQSINEVTRSLAIEKAKNSLAAASSKEGERDRETRGKGGGEEEEPNGGNNMRERTDDGACAPPRLILRRREDGGAQQSGRHHRSDQNRVRPAASERDRDQRENPTRENPTRGDKRDNGESRGRWVREGRGGDVLARRTEREGAHKNKPTERGSRNGGYDDGRSKREALWGDNKDAREMQRDDSRPKDNKDARGGRDGDKKNDRTRRTDADRRRIREKVSPRSRSRSGRRRSPSNRRKRKEASPSPRTSSQSGSCTEERPFIIHPNARKKVTRQQDGKDKRVSSDKRKKYIGTRAARSVSSESSESASSSTSSPPKKTKRSS